MSFEISIQNFHQLITSMKHHFVLTEEGSRCQKFVFLKLQMGLEAPIFELHPSNFVKFHISLGYKSAEIFVLKSQVVSE